MKTLEHRTIDFSLSTNVALIKADIEDLSIIKDTITNITNLRTLLLLLI